MTAAHRRSVVVVGHGEEPRLNQCLASLLRDLASEDQLVLVDNGIDDLTSALADLEGVSLVGNGDNLGFGAGCNLGAGRSTGRFLIFVNSDAIVHEGAIDALTRALAVDEVGIATGSLRLAQEPTKVNSRGNPVHFLGITWAGGLGEFAERHSEPKDVASASGAFFGLRREVWDELGGFDPLYFMYHEDVDLSLRCWLAGRRVSYVPDAIADHDYSFSRNPDKMYLLERNRLVTVLTDYPGPVLRRVLPALIATEPLLLGLAVAHGWARQKLCAWAWLIRKGPILRARRGRVQSAAATPHAMTAVLSSRLGATAMTVPGLALLNALLEAYWRSVCRMAQRGLA